MNRRWLKPAVVLVLILGLVAIIKLFHLDQRLGDFSEWIAAQGMMGPVFFAGTFALATVLALPGSVLTIMAGALFGSVIGVATVMVGATVGASLCFLISRYVARDAIAAWLFKSDKFRKLDKLTEQNGATIVAITRLVPLFPYNLLNYGFGLTKVPFWTYVLWSALCMLPRLILFVVSTDALATAVRERRVPWNLLAVVVVILAILVAVIHHFKGKLKA